MSASIVPKLTRISPEKMVSYLRRTGWQQIDSASRNDFCFHAPSWTPDFPLRIPSHINMSDYSSRVFDFVALVAQLNNTEIDAAFSTIYDHDLDIDYIRLRTAPSNPGSTELGAAATLLNQYQNVIQAAAVEEIEERTVTRLTKTAKNFVNKKCYLGHTEQGSFVLRVEFELDYSYSSDFKPIDVTPTARRISTRIYNSLATLAAATEAGSVEPIVKNTEIGMTYLILKAICDIGKKLPDLSFSHNIQFSENLAQNLQLFPADRPIFKIQQNTYEMAQTASNLLRDNQDRPGQSVNGIVTILHSEKSLTDPLFATAGREIVVHWIDGLYTRNVHVELTLPQYKEALLAHQNGRQIYIIGDLVKRGKFWWLDNPRNFAVIN